MTRFLLRPAVRHVAALLTMLSVAACSPLARGEGPEAPSGDVRAASGDTRPLLAAASTDLACDASQVKVVQRYDGANDPGGALGYVVEGCGQRAIYGESCRANECAYFFVASAPREPVYPKTLTELETPHA